MPDALVAGATGLVGGHLVHALASCGRYGRIWVLSRRAIQGWPAPVQRLLVDYDRLSASQLPAVDDVFCALGTTIRKAGSREAFRRVDYEYPLRLARLCREQGASQLLLVSSVGADARSSNFYLRVKGELEQAVAGVGFEKLQIFRPAVLLGVRDESRPGEIAGKALSIAFGFLLAGGLRKYRAMPADRLAQAMVRVAGAAGPGGVYHYNEIISA
jgi:uncharacterized protein YbjT (DUF2867 family)